MSNLTKQLAEVQQNAKQNIPAEIYKTMIDETDKLKATGIEGKAIQNGEPAPDFTLPNHLGDNVNLGALLQEGPLVVSFYRGGW